MPLGLEGLQGQRQIRCGVIRALLECSLSGRVGPGPARKILQLAAGYGVGHDGALVPLSGGFSGAAAHELHCSPIPGV